MRLELAERLRCPNPHAPTPMVVVARAKRGFELVTGFAGCPVCHLEARFEDGDLRFPGEAVPSSAATPNGAMPELDRTIALMGLAEPGGAVLLTGRYAALASQLVERLDVSVVLLGTDRRDGASEVAAVVRGPTANVPFTDGTFRAAALDGAIPGPLIADLVRTIAIGGRMLATSGHRLPAGLKELARDDLEWVAARESGGAIVELVRRKPVDA